MDQYCGLRPDGRKPVLVLAPFLSPFAVLRVAALAVPGGGIVCVMENGSTEDERSAMEMNPITGGGVADDDVLVGGLSA